MPAERKDINRLHEQIRIVMKTGGKGEEMSRGKYDSKEMTRKEKSISFKTLISI